jgi:hypothetical protein
MARRQYYVIPRKPSGIYIIYNGVENQEFVALRA